ncbi:MAG TPA: AI-2E family transporter, partial [Candidatus Methylomirabilis sp.]|nr:AI-2E family transporter [Candidatus Methylomirabilis sp.]
MFSIDDHAGNVVTTVTVFMVAATILYVARGAFLILFLSLLFAYLLEPAVAWIQHHSRLGQKNRMWAIAQVYLVGTLVLGGLGYEFGPHFAAQIRNLNAAVPGILDGISSGRTAAGLGGRHGLSATQQQW